MLGLIDLTSVLGLIDLTSVLGFIDLTSVLGLTDLTSVLGLTDLGVPGLSHDGEDMLTWVPTSPPHCTHLSSSWPATSGLPA